MGRILLLSCSNTKVPDRGPIPAIDRYDGPAFRVVRKFFREVPADSQDVELYILSAKYGLISAGESIEPYDRRMTPDRAKELRAPTVEKLIQALHDHKPSQLLISMGRDYLRAIEGYESQLPAGVEQAIADGPTGKKLSKLKNWLYGTQPRQREYEEMGVRQPELPIDVPRSVQIRGRTIALSAQQAIEQARLALRKGEGDPDRYRSWFSVVDGQRVSPKWWVSQMSGLPVGAFGADEARRVLRGLGIEVFRRKS